MADLISIADASRRVLDASRPLGTETIPVADALDRVLAEALESQGDVPPFPSSAMDGYAVLAGPAGRSLAVVDESRAGAPSERAVHDGEAIRISTGAAVPAGATAVVPQEEVKLEGDAVRLEAEAPEGAHIRPAGEVMRRGMTVLPAGTRLGAAELGAAVAAGAGEVTVGRRPRVGVLSTGDELREPGAPLASGEIHNSNGPMLAALTRHAGGVPDPPGHLPDDRAATETALDDAIDGADVVIISGGVSVGPHDHVKPALAALGVDELFWGVALQPGKPTWFGTRDGKLVFGLPGNPVSAAVTFSLFVAPALAALQGAELPDAGHAVLGAEVRRNRRREQALRVRLERRDGGGVVAIPNGPQASHVIVSLLGADALALIPAGEGSLEAGTTVALAPLVR